MFLSPKGGYLIYNAQVTPPAWLQVVARLARETELRQAQEDMATAMAAGYRRYVSREQALALAGKAMAAGCYWPTSADGQLVPRLEWDIAGRCVRPVPVEVLARRSIRLTDHVEGPITVQLFTRCRRCMWCKQQRASLWMARAANETAAAPRTWFATLTLSPDAQYAALAQARASCSLQGVDFEGLRESEKFEAHVRAIGVDLTKWIKRVRKNSGAPIRLLIVAERHKSGAPHFHLLIHERDVDRPLRKVYLRDSWELGWANFKLVEDQRSAAYVCKYLAKESAARVRASFRYGQAPSYLTELDRAPREPVENKPPQEQRIIF